MSQWIKVKDKLPEIRQRILTITDYGGMDVCRFMPHNESLVGAWVNAMRGQHSNGGVTHWMPLPEPPTNES